jgi:hypothetical protein|tara:strand:- start:485 stop:943 length:459 start_codon:yes stop_codon:yes gene_type:complete
MASTLTPTTFRIKIKEEHIVKGLKTLNETFFTIKDITNVDRRIVTLPPTTSIDLININGVDPGPGTFPSSSMKYVRISNLDTSSSLAVSFTSSNSDNWSMKCLPESSLMFSSPDVTGSEFNGTFPDDITNIALYSLSSSLDVEYVVVNSDNA